MKITNFFTIHFSRLIIIILLLAGVLRLWNLNNVPPHLTPDEAALGYNAYSILKTGRDEYGKFMPLIFKSFGDYKPGLFVYATVPFVGIMGLNEWSVRLPSALFGITIVYLLYLISKKMFIENNSLPENKLLPLIVALVASTNPWLIYFSRGAWEVNLSLMLTLFGLLFFLKSFSNYKFLILSSLFFAMTLLAYQGAKLSTGIVLVLLVVVYWKKFWSIPKKYLISSVFLGFLISLPILFSLFSGQTGRLEVFSVFSYPRPKDYIEVMLNQGGEKIGDIKYYLYHGETYNFLRGVLGRWFNHFSGRFLFFEGDWSNPRHSAPYQGVLLLIDMVGLVVGLFVIFKDKINKENAILLFWLVLSPLPAILSRDQVHAVRSFNMAIPLIIIIAFGFNYIVFWIKTLKFSKVFYAVLVVCYTLSAVYFIDSYFVHLPRHDSKLWEYGYEQIVETVTPIEGNYKKVVVQQSFAQPYIYFLFFNQYDPAKYQKENSFVNSEYKFDVGYVTRVGNIYFEAIDWSRNRGDHGTLFVADTLRIPPLDSADEKEFKLIKEIKYLDNKVTAFRILEIK